MGGLIEPLTLPFMQTAFAGALLIGITCAVLGVYVVLRGMAFIGDALAHTTLPGLVMAYFSGVNLSVGGLVAAMFTALGIGWVARRGTVREDTAIGIFFTSMFALGILLMSSANTFRSFSQMLFGYILGISSSDLVFIGLVAALVLLVLWLFHKELELTSVDPAYAESIGLRPDLVRFGLLALLALTVVTAIQAVGVVLSNALLVTPAAAASLLTNRLPKMMALAATIAVVSATAGIYASYYWKVAPGAAIVLACTGCFGLAWLVRTLRLRQGAERAVSTSSLPESGY